MALPLMTMSFPALFFMVYSPCVPRKSPVIVDKSASTVATAVGSVDTFEWDAEGVLQDQSSKTRTMVPIKNCYKMEFKTGFVFFEIGMCSFSKDIMG